MVGTFVAVRAQGPLTDKVIVDLPYTVTVRDTTLQPGQYTIQRSWTGDNNRVVQIFSNDGMKLETAVLTVPTVDNNTPDKTEVVLHHFGNDYYFDKVWIQGKDYGYEFPLPQDVKSRESERGAAVTVGANYETAPGGTTATAAQSSAATSESAQAQQPAATEQPSTTESAAHQPSASQPTAAAQEPEAQTTASTEAATRENTPSASTQPLTSQPSASQQSAATQDPEAQMPASSEAATQQNATSHDSQQMAQAQPPASTPGGDTPAATTETPSAESESRNREMPKTASNWLAMLLTGCVLSATGIALRRAAA